MFVGEGVKTITYSVLLYELLYMLLGGVHGIGNPRYVTHSLRPSIVILELDPHIKFGLNVFYLLAPFADNDANRLARHWQLQRESVAVTASDQWEDD